MKNFLAPIVAGAVSLAFPFSASGVVTDFVIFKAAASLPVTYVETVNFVDKQYTKVLTSKEIINLSLGRAADTKLDPKTEVLALAVAYEDDGQPPGTADPQVTVVNPRTRVILWNPQATGDARWVKTIATITELEYDRVFGNNFLQSGQGFATVVIPEGAPVGGAADNKFLATTFHGTGKLKQNAHDVGSPVVGQLKTFAFSVTGLGGRVKFNFTDAKTSSPGKAINGVAVKGKVTTTGTPLEQLIAKDEP